MAVVIIYNATDPTVPNRVTSRLPSANTPEYDQRPDTLINPDESGVTKTPAQTVAVPGSNAVRDMTQGELDALVAADGAAFDAATRQAAKDYKTGFENKGLYLRAVADVIKDELNILRGWLVDFKAEVAASTSLADLQTRVATLPDLPDRSLSQIKGATDSRIDSGDVDGD